MLILSWQFKETPQGLTSREVLLCLSFLLLNSLFLNHFWTLRITDLTVAVLFHKSYPQSLRFKTEKAVGRTQMNIQDPNDGSLKSLTSTGSAGNQTCDLPSHLTRDFWSETDNRLAWRHFLMKLYVKMCIQNSGNVFSTCYM